MRTFVQDFLKYWPFSKDQSAVVMILAALLAIILLFYPHVIRWCLEEDEEYDDTQPEIPYRTFNTGMTNTIVEIPYEEPEMPSSSGIWRKVSDNIVADTSDDSDEFPWIEEMRDRSVTPRLYEENWYKRMQNDHKRWVSDMRDEIYEIREEIA